jgi:hypothetical protein
MLVLVAGCAQLSVTVTFSICTLASILSSKEGVQLAAFVQLGWWQAEGCFTHG